MTGLGPPLWAMTILRGRVMVLAYRARGVAKGWAAKSRYFATVGALCISRARTGAGPWFQSPRLYSRTRCSATTRLTSVEGVRILIARDS